MNRNGFNDFVKIISLMGRRLWLYIIATLLISGCFSSQRIISAFINKQIIDAVIIRDKSLFLNSTLLAIVVIGICCVINPLSVYLFDYTVKNVMVNIESKVFAKIHKLDMRYFDSTHSGEIISRTTNDMRAINDTYCFTLYRVVETIILGVGSLLAMITLSWQFTILLCIIGAISVSINICFSKQIRTLSDTIQQLLGKAMEHFADAIGGIRIVKIFNLNEKMVNKYNEINQSLFKNQIQRFKVSAKLDSINFSFSIISLAALVLTANILVENSWMSIGTVIAVFGLQGNISGMFLNLGSFFADLQGSLAGAVRVFEILEQEEEPEQYAPIIKDIDENIDNVGIEFKNVDFSFNEENNILKSISFQVTKEKNIAIVGTSGAGKSTISKLLLGYYPVNSGYIVVNGKALTSYQLEDLRKQISYIAQDNYLFRGSIKENIAYGKLDAKDEEIIEAAKKAGAHDFITALDNGYETVINERGNSLSGGQRQRIAIARAILKDAPVLILDEATSALDNETEIKIQKELKVLMDGKTTLTIAHRLTTIKDADEIFVLDKGEIIERGTHEELLKNKGFYFEMWQQATKLEVRGKDYECK